jgi:hypothetical protein
VPKAIAPKKLHDGTALAVWNTLEMAGRVHKGLARNAKMGNNERLERYHHGYEEGLKKAMSLIVEKFGDEE